MGAALVGLAFCFRYSALIPIVMLLMLPAVHKAWWTPRLLLVFLGPLLLFVFDVWAYGEVHFVHMIGFQAIERTVLDRVH